MKSNINRKYDVNELFFKNINSKEKAYFLGLMYADGSISDRSIIISLQERDCNILEKFKKIIGYTGPLRYVNKKNKKWQNHKILCIYSRELVKDLTLLGCGKRKTYNLKFPKINKQYYSHFIRGVFDGDGCIISNKNGYYFSITGYKTFMKEINTTITRELKFIPCKISRKNKSSELFGALQYSKNSTLIKLRTYLYNDCNDLYIKRKYVKFFEIEEKITKVCKICSKPHEAKGYCKTCYHREVFYSPLKKNKIIISKNLKTNKTKEFKTIKEIIIETNLKYHSIWNNLNNKSKRSGIYSFNYKKL
jgi:hypothetical protein